MNVMDAPFVQDWQDCRRCGLCQFRRKVAIARGVVPAKLMFIGEGPGRSEDLTGEPFIGPSGRLLRIGVGQAEQMVGVETTILITNVVGCRPTDSQGGVNREPTGEEALACWPRLEKLYLLAQPARVVFLGRVAERFCGSAFPDGVYIQHPSFIKRTGGEASAYWKGFVRALADSIGGSR